MKHQKNIKLAVVGLGYVGLPLLIEFGKAGFNVLGLDIDPKKIGNTRRGKPIIPPEDLLTWLSRYQNPIVLAAVGARGARKLIRERLNAFGLREGYDWWAVA